MIKEKLKIGIIGCGGIANQKHLPNLSRLTELCELTAFCDIVPERAERARREYGTADARVYTDYRELLADPGVDVVHVLTPNVLHSPMAVDAFRAGKHVMCEKPMAASTEDAKRMIDAWRESGKKFTVGYQNRFRRDAQALHTACERGELGEIYYAKAHAVRRRGVPTWGVFPNKALQGGGPLIDIGTHALDLTLWMMDNYRPRTVLGSVFYKLGRLPEATEGNMFGPWDPETYEVEDSAFGMIRMEDGSTVSLDASWALNIRDVKEAATTLCGTLAGAELTADARLIMNRGHNGLLTDEVMAAAGEIAYFEGGSSDPGFLEAKQWLEAIIFDREPLVRPEQAYVVTQILEAIYESAKTGHEVELRGLEESE